MDEVISKGGSPMLHRYDHIVSAMILALVATTSLNAQGRGAPPDAAGGGGRATWDVTQARGQTRDIDFTTSEGTWMSADLSPDRTWIAFDLLGHVYKMPSAGEPAWTPDGSDMVVRKGGRGGGGEGGAPAGGMWMYHKDGGQGVQIIGAGAGRGGGGGGNGEPSWPSVSGDGKFLYYQVGM